MIHESMRLLFAAFALSFVTATFAADSAQKQPKMTPKQQAEMDAYMKAGTPGAAHTALASTAGNYDIKMKSWMEAGAPPMEESGTATRKMALDGRVLIEEVKSTMMGKPFIGQAMTGYDNVTGKYWSTWNDNTSTGLMLSEGTCDASKSCKFTGSWNDPVKKGRVKARMTSRWTNPSTEVFEMHGPGRDGKEMKMLEITYTKK
ncbi:MAG TPA: DUF1579 domain-containing protein [Casimicrobiaceae bacterium]|nr:DUF1579 domain-containing protein [Casimicrobiaceae bacterium]